MLPTNAVQTARMVDVFLQYLIREGARVIFGVPGGLIHPFCEAIEQHDGLQLIVPKHEEGGAFMADGYARIHRRLAVCMGTSGPGATNMLTGVAVAFSDGVPLLVVTGQAASHAIGKGAAQETGREDIDIVEMFRPVTKYSAMVTSPEHLSRHLRRALRRALTGRMGPVHLNIPVELWGQPADEHWFAPQTYRPITNLFDREAVKRASRKLLTSSYPVLLVGSGVAASGAEEHVIALAELIEARVCTSPRAKGVFPEDHRLSMGVLGFAGHSEAKATLLGDQVDTLMTIGASLNETTTFNWHPRLRPLDTLIQLDIDVDRIGRNYPVDIPLVGDALTVLVECVYHIHRLIRDGSSSGSRWPEVSSRRLDHGRYLDPDLRRSGATPLTPQRWRAELQEVLPDNAIVFSDIGGHMLFNLHHLCIGRHQRFVLNLGFGSMGHGTVAPIGAGLGGTDRPLVAIIGDGCFTMNGMELLTAVEYDVPVTWIVENNQMHGITWHGSKMVSNGRAMAAVRYRRRIEIASIARAMGLSAWVVEEPNQLPTALEQALSAKRPSLIEVRVDGSLPPPLADRAETIAGFRGHES